MTIDPRLVDIDRTADDREPTDIYADQMAVAVDNLMSGYLRKPERTDAVCKHLSWPRCTDLFWLHSHVRRRVPTAPAAGLTHAREQERANP